MLTLLSVDPGGPETLILAERPRPRPAVNEVRIAVRAAALNYPDVLLIQDRYQMRPPRPFAPGSEVAGTIDAVGAGVTGFQAGDRIMATMAYGGLAEAVVVPASACVRIADGVPFAEAAALLVTYGTARYALRDVGALQAGETLAVLGAAGGVGLAAIQLGKAIGARVVAAVSTARKAEIAQHAGADAAVVYPPAILDRAAARAFSAALRSAAGDRSVDVIVDPVGGGYSEPAFRAIGWGGRHLILGFTAGIPCLPLNLPLLKGAAVHGVFYGDFAHREPTRWASGLAELAELHGRQVVRPHVDRSLPLERAIEGLIALTERKVCGKIVITI